MFTEQQNLAIVRTELDRVFYQKFDYPNSIPSQATARTEAIFRQMETDHAQYIQEVFKGSGLFPVVGETQTVPSSTPQVANKLTTSIKDFAQGIEISKDLFDDNMHGVWARTVEDFGNMARVSQDQNAFAFINGFFTTSLTADGAAVVASHTLISGATYNNQLTSNPVLSEPNLNTAFLALQGQPNQSNVVLGTMPEILLVPPALFKKAIQLTESVLIPGAGDNDINVYRSAYGITVYTSPYLSAATGGSDTAWYVMGSNHGLTRIVRQGIQTALRGWEYSNNRTYFYQANFREAVMCPDYVGIVGSTGLGS